MRSYGTGMDRYLSRSDNSTLICQIIIFGIMTDFWIVYTYDKLVRNIFPFCYIFYFVNRYDFGLYLSKMYCVQYKLNVLCINIILRLDMGLAFSLPDGKICNRWACTKPQKYNKLEAISSKLFGWDDRESNPYDCLDPYRPFVK